MKKVLFAFVLLVCPVTLIHAQMQQQVFNGPNPQQWNWPSCAGNSSAAEIFAMGVLQPDGATVLEFNDGLEFYSTAQPALCVLTTSYTTALAHNIQAIDIHGGSSYGADLEWIFFVDITVPAQGAVPPKRYHLRQQFDKHQDGLGSMDRYLRVSWSLPAGTTVTITRPGVVCLGIPNHGMYNPAYPGDFGPYNQNNCATGQSITLIGQ